MFYDFRRLKQMKQMSVLSTLSLAALVSLVGFGCQPVNVQEPNKKSTDEDRVRARRENRTQLSSFYGLYQTLEQSGQRVSDRSQAGRSDLVCDTTTEIDNANISKYRTRSGGAIKAETFILDFFDPRTREYLPADEIWVSSGVVRSRLGNDVCGEFAVPLFANRGQWRPIANGFEYEFHGTLLQRVGEDENSFEQTQIDEVVRVRRLSDGFEIGIRYNSPRGSFDEVWKVRAEGPVTSSLPQSH